MDPLDLIRQGKVKRFFRATRKITAPKVISHLTQRAAGKEPLFLEDDDYLFMLATMKDVAQKRSLTIYSFCLKALLGNNPGVHFSLFDAKPFKMVIWNLFSLHYGLHPHHL